MNDPLTVIYEYVLSRASPSKEAHDMLLEFQKKEKEGTLSADDYDLLGNACIETEEAKLNRDVAHMFPWNTDHIESTDLSDKENTERREFNRSQFEKQEVWKSLNK